MSMTDPVSDFLTRVRNGITAAHQEVEIPSSKLKREMARILKEQGYIRDFEIEAPTPDHPGELIRVTLKYTDERRSAITGPQARLAPRASATTSATPRSPRSSAAWGPRSCPPRGA